MSVALALIPRDMARDGLTAEIEILGRRRQATRITTPLYDPDAPVALNAARHEPA